MIDKEKKIVLFERARITLYLVLIVAGVLVCKLPVQYICDYEGYSCMFCGMRHAVDYALVFDFKNAMESNPLILTVGIIFLDVFLIIIRTLLRRIRHAKR